MLKSNITIIKRYMIVFDTNLRFCAPLNLIKIFKFPPNLTIHLRLSSIVKNDIYFKQLINKRLMIGFLMTNVYRFHKFLIFLNSKNRRIQNQIMKLFNVENIQIPQSELSQELQDHLSSDNLSRSNKLHRTKQIGKFQKSSTRVHLKKLTKTKHDNFSTTQHSSNNQNHQVIKDQPRTTQILQEQEHSPLQNSQCPILKNLDNFQNSNLTSISQLPTDKFTQYCEEIYEYMRIRQLEYIPVPIDNSFQTSQFIRNKLVDWLFKVSKVFNFKIQTAFLAVNIVDRTLSLKSFQKKKLQLLGITSLFLAAKYQQIMIPKLSNFSGLTSDDIRVSKASILQLQKVLIPLLNFDFSYISPSTFIDLIGCRYNISKQEKEKSIKVSVDLMLKSELRNMRSSHIAWISLFEGCSDNRELQQFIHNNEELAFHVRSRKEKTQQFLN